MKKGAEDTSVDLSWDFERVWQLELALDAEKPGLDPKGPTAKWQALHYIEKARIRYSKGDRAALFYAIYQCAMRDLLIPEWAASAFRTGYREILSCKVDSWDKAFGTPYPKDLKISLAPRRIEVRFKVFRRIMDILNRERVPIDDELFQRVATELYIGKRQCKESWYAMGGLPRNQLKKRLPP